jgi:N-glycosylase/DNA lyase
MKDGIEELHETYRRKCDAIRDRLEDFDTLGRRGDDSLLFEELVFCIFTAGASARMGLKSIDRVKPHLLTGNRRRLTSLLSSAHRYPVARSRYIVHTRKYLQDACRLRLSDQLAMFGDDSEARRDFFADNPGIKGIGYKEASHFLRNIGYKGYAILDKHILRTLFEYGVINSANPPSTKRKYLAIEHEMKKFSDHIGINFDELDLLLWSNKTGEILK